MVSVILHRVTSLMHWSVGFFLTLNKRGSCILRISRIDVSNSRKMAVLLDTDRSGIFKSIVI
jgi:hypothetical protein